MRHIRKCGPQSWDPPKVISERLRHSTAAFTLETYTHVIPGMDEAAANTVAALIIRHCDRPIGHRFSPVRQGPCQGFCHPFFMPGTNHAGRAALGCAGGMTRALRLATFPMTDQVPGNGTAWVLSHPPRPD